MVAAVVVVFAVVVCGVGSGGEGQEDVAAVVLVFAVVVVGVSSGGEE